MGLLNVVNLKDEVNRDELFSFNIRRFLGLRKGSVSWKIKQSLDDEEKRERFWILNNGIVCLCTEFKEEDNTVNFKNFTIVNGAQTINTIARFLVENPLIDKPIWTVAKVLKVSETEVRKAAEITEASNTQTPTSTRDLRATDLVHSKIEDWLRTEFDLGYVYKRGQRGINAVKMKDLAQAYVSFWREEPNISFSRPRQIFANNSYYEDVFPPGRIDELKRQGTRTEIRDFLVRRLVPWKITVKTREFLRKNTGPGTIYDKKFRSLTYHMTWLFGELLEEKLDSGNLEKVYQRVEDILNISEEPLFREIYSFLTYTRTEIPRSLKSTIAKEEMSKSFIPSPQFQRMKEQVLNLIP
jgi:DNA-binding transcriptional ArsR family regulator